MRNDFAFEAADKTLKEVLFSSKKYCVPRYQRPYAWDIEQVTEFWEDLTSSEEPYFLGSFIFNTEIEKETGYADIIDGQQRLLTITIFISVLRDIAKELDDETAKRYQRQDIAIEDRSGQQSFRILPADTLRDFFEKYIQSGSGDISESSPRTREEDRIRRVYEFLYDRASAEIRRFKTRELQLGVLDKLRHKVSDLIVIGVDIAREEDAYEIFETTNARGVDLSVSDLLKNLIFRKIPAGEDRDLAKETWQEVTSNIEATSTELKRFIRYFWISRHAFVHEKKVYREIKKNVTDWQGLLTDLGDDAFWYNRLIEGNEADFEGLKHDYRIYSAVFALRLMSVSQCYVLLLSILRNYDKLGTDPTRIFELIERFTFQYSVVCKLPGNKVEKIYSRFALKIEEAVRSTPPKKLPGTIQSIFTELERALKAEAPSESLFKESFAELSYRNSEQNRKLLKYILAKIDGHLSKTDEHRIDFNRVNIEHILPQNPSQEWGLSKREIREYVNLLGNLTLISMIINSKVQNGPISQKLPELARSELAITKNLVETIRELNGQWTRRQIIERQDLLATLAYNQVWRL